MARFLRPLSILLCALVLFCPAPARAADEGAQVQMLKKLFLTPMPDWPDVLDDYKSLLDSSFFDRVERRIRWSLDNAQVEDAVRFAIVGDMAAMKVGRKTTYRLDMARFFLGLNNAPMAMDLLTNILVQDEENQPARFLQASILHDSGGAGQIDAYAIYRHLAGQNYRKAECLYRMALIDRLRMDDEAARRHLEEALRADPKLTAAREELDRMLASERNLHFAPPAPGEKPGGTSTSPGSGGPVKVTAEQAARANSFMEEAEALRAQGNLTGAINLYHKAVEANPNLVKARVYLGAAYFQTRNLDAAIGQLLAATGLDASDAEAWRYLGFAYERRFDGSHSADDLAQALAAFEKAAGLEPNNAILQMDVERVRDKSQSAAGSPSTAGR